jgi:hypothetical protein
LARLENELGRLTNQIVAQIGNSAEGAVKEGWQIVF